MKFKIDLVINGVTEYGFFYDSREEAQKNYNAFVRTYCESIRTGTHVELRLYKIDKSYVLIDNIAIRK
jgi:hypothetical protein